MNKRGQVTIFIIIAILIIAFAVIYFTVLNNQKENLDTIDSDSVYYFVQSCFESTAEKIIYNVGKGGGYYFPPSKSLDSGTPIYLYYGEKYVPSKKDIEEEISHSIGGELPLCIKNFQSFTDYEISDREISVTTEILNDTVRVKMDYPIYVSKGEATDKIEEFNAEIKVRFGTVYNSILEEINSETEQGICISCINKIIEENNLYLEMFNYRDLGVIFVWTDKKFELNGENFEYVYANAY